MKTWEMYRLIAEEGKIRFRREKDGAIYKWKSGHMLPEERRGHSPFIGLNEEWYEVDQPVPFITAFRVLREHRKDIYCVYEAGRHYYYANYPGTHCFNEEHIANGEWFIE